MCLAIYFWLHELTKSIQHDTHHPETGIIVPTSCTHSILLRILLLELQSTRSYASSSRSSDIVYCNTMLTYNCGKFAISLEDLYGGYGNMCMSTCTMHSDTKQNDGKSRHDMWHIDKLHNRNGSA